MTRCWSGWSEDKGKGTANAGSSTACLTKCREPLRSGRHGVGVVGARTRARARRMQVLRLRVSRSAVSHFAQDDTVLEWLERGQERGHGKNAGPSAACLTKCREPLRSG